ncbi:MAG: hypothetical protein OEX00_01600 [Gammaproteobacteria bacterium]|nr:hypothetical protein [Gammaproteobacteria bacterium]MDH5693434.1 hypothetical protein [Gammaproteobacteria bacterium]
MIDDFLETEDAYYFVITERSGIWTVQATSKVINAIYLTPMGSNFYFQTQDPSNSDIELWKSDGT